METAPRTPAEKRQTLAKDATETERREMLVKKSVALQPYGTVQELSEMVKRFKFMIPGGSDLTDQQAWGLAQSAISVGLNPFLKEIIWLDGPYVTEKGYTKKMHEYGDNHGLGQPSVTVTQVTDPREFEIERIPLGALTFKVVGGFQMEHQEYTDRLQKARQALGSDAPWKAVLEAAGPRAERVGIGYVTAEQMAELDNPSWFHKCKAKPDLNTVERKGKGGSTWMARQLRGFDPCPDCGGRSFAKPPTYPHSQRARKRAMMHWMKQSIDIPFAMGGRGEPLAEEIVEADFREVSPETQAEWDRVVAVAQDQGWSGETLEGYLRMNAEEEERKVDRMDMTEEEIRAKAEEGIETLYGTPQPKPKPRPEQPKTTGRSWPTEKVKEAERALVEAGILKPGAHVKHVVNFLNLTPYNISAPISKFITWGQVYRKYTDLGMKETDAAAEATKELGG
jgi:hypothetical protein